MIGNSRQPKMFWSSLLNAVMWLSEFEVYAQMQITKKSFRYNRFQSDWSTLHLKCEFHSKSSSTNLKIILVFQLIFMVLFFSIFFYFSIEIQKSMMISHIYQSTVSSWPNIPSAHLKFVKRLWLPYIIYGICGTSTESYSSMKFILWMLKSRPYMIYRFFWVDSSSFKLRHKNKLWQKDEVES